MPEKTSQMNISDNNVLESVKQLDQDLEDGYIIEKKDKRPGPFTSHKKRTTQSSEDETIITEDGATEINPAPRKRGKDSTSATVQPTILSMFCKVPASKKRRSNVEQENKNTTEISGNDYEEKRIKVDGEDGMVREREPLQRQKMLEEQITTSPCISKEKTLPVKCKDCKQLLDDPDLKMYLGDTVHSVEEFVMLTDPKLSLFTGEESEMNEADERPQHKITQFSVFDKSHHLCPFDSGLIEKNVELYFSGYVKPIYEENPDSEGGIPTRNMGPINEWWTAGFDGGENALIGFSTAFADYILMQPSEQYTPFMDLMREKIYLSKVVIEYLASQPDALYEDLLNHIQTTVPPQGLNGFTEDVLLRHSQWVVDQVESYDEAADSDESLLVTTSCMRALIKLAGVTLGKRRAMRKQVRGVKPKQDKAGPSMATVTLLVSDIFDKIFSGQLTEKETSTTKRRRCGICEVCQQPDCGKCKACQDMIKFGGSGKSKQACMNRRCPNLAVKEAEDDDILEDIDEDKENKLTTCNKYNKTEKSSLHKCKKQKTNLIWEGEPVKKEVKKTFYDAVYINNELVQVGDYISVKPDDPTIPLYVAKACYFWEDANGEKMFHAQWFNRGSDTLLGETADPLELFMVDDCQDTQLAFALCKVTVLFKPPERDWFMRGGCEEFNDDRPVKEDDGKTFFFQKWYDAALARFEDVPEVTEPTDVNEFCHSCTYHRIQEKKVNPQLGKKCDLQSSTEVHYESVQFEDEEYKIGDCTYFSPSAFTVGTNKQTSKRSRYEKDYDDELYPEAYRKSEYVKGSNETVPEPFRIARILDIYTAKGIGSKPSVDEVMFKLAKFYRPENTHRGKTASYQTDLNMLYWSDQETKAPLSECCGKCTVVCSEDLNISIEEYSRIGLNRFYFIEAYDPKKKKVPTATLR